MSDDHAHDHDHTPDPRALRAEALEGLLVEKGLVDSSGIDAIVQTFERDIGPLRGARIVARAWTDPDYKQRLLDDGLGAIRELGFDGPEVQHLVVVENTPDVHNLVVCTLCSCYPWAVLGLPPAWYKSPAYRSRAVREPRAVLKEFGLELSRDVEVRVWDSSAEIRYMVLPRRPAGSEGLSEDALVALCGRDAMIGAALASDPG